MGDATHDSVSALPRTLDLVAGYVTGSPTVQWTAADFARFPGIPHVTVDQAYTGSPAPAAVVRDVEPGAWTAHAAVTTSPWTPVRPTIYCDRADLPAVLQAGWRGDLWLAIPGWAEGATLPPAPGCRIVAVQNRFDVANAYDLSVVLDPAWPLRTPVIDPTGADIMKSYTTSDGRLGVALVATDGNVYVTEQTTPGSAWSGIAGHQPPPVPAPVASLDVDPATVSLFIQPDPSKGTWDVWTTWRNPDGTWADWTPIT